MPTVRPYIHVQQRAPHESGTLKHEKQRENERERKIERQMQRQADKGKKDSGDQLRYSLNNV